MHFRAPFLLCTDPPLPDPGLVPAAAGHRWPIRDVSRPLHAARPPLPNPGLLFGPQRAARRRSRTCLVRCRPALAFKGLNIKSDDILR